jgi:hypothetical protein
LGELRPLENTVHHHTRAFAPIRPL